MKKKGCTLWGLTLAALALVLVCLVAFLGLNWQAGAGAFENRPLVLIHSPVNHDQVHVGDGILVHATARADNGLRRIELWADGVFVDARDATGNPTLFVFAGSWVPTAEGSHALVVRAVSSDGTEGQATVSVDALPQEAADVGAEAETAAPLPDDGAGASSDGSGAPGDGAAPGGEGGEGGAGEEGAPGGGDGSGEEGAPGDEGGSEEGGEPPVPEGEPPEDEPLWDFPLLEPLHVFPFRPGDPTGLRVEFLGLTTPTAYEQLHCYVGYADMAPLWYPDNDGDQTTDESFALAGAGAGGEASWNLAGLSGESMPVFQWHRETSLPINVSCVGIAGGGTDALELGMWEESVPPEMWTGVTFFDTAVGSDGSFSIYYRITRLGLWESGEALETDFDMTAPTNVRLDQSNSALRWDYTPRPEEDSISGFRVYLNGSLQWVEPADARESSLPSEWLNPPCGTTYRFDVTAYRGGQESLPGSAFLEQSLEDCNREVAITFVSLETFDLPGDGDAGDRTGDIGPAYGFFWANEQQVTFSGGHLGPGLDLPVGLSDNTTYNISEMAASFNFSGEPTLLATIPDGGAFQFGFHIDDEDSGHCHDSDDPGCDDLICEGFSDIYEEEAVSDALDSHHEETITSADGRCRLTVQWGPAAGSPVGSGLEGWEPAPWLNLEKMTVDEATGQVRLDIRNTGTAAWSGRDLNIELQSRIGLSIGVYTWTGFTLEAGQRATLEHPDMRLAAPFDACVMIDPYNDVVEEYERVGGAWHIPICPPLPDLVITEVEYMPAGDFGELHVTVANGSDAAITNRAFALDAFLADGSPLVVGSSYPNISLGPRETVRLSIVGVGAGTYEQMRAGYSVVVNAGHAIAETNYDNNTFTVGPTIRVRFEPLEFYSGRAGENQLQCETEVYFRILIGHGVSRDTVDWTEVRYPHSGHLTYRADICGEPRPGPWIPDGSYYTEIDIPSGESLYLSIGGWEIDDPGEDDYLGAIDLRWGPDLDYGEGEFGWTLSLGGYNNDLEPNGGHNFQARWRIVIVTP